MGYAVRVDPDAVDRLATQLRRVGHNLERAAQGAARTWQLAASGTASPELEAAASASSRRWGAGIDVTGRLADELAVATAAAGEAYREVEASVARSWTVSQEMPGRAAGWRP